MTEGFKWHPELFAVLLKHFPGAPEEKLEHWSREIYSDKSLSSAVEQLERSDRPAAKDLESLRVIEKSLRRTIKELHNVGWYGGKSLCLAANSLAKKENHTTFPFDAQVLRSAPYIADHLAELADSVSNAQDLIDEDAPSVNAAFGEGPEFGRRTGKPTNTTAQSTADECAKAYHALSGVRPTVSTNDGTAYGPFLEFVSDMFSALEIEASPETWSRRSVRNFPAKT